MTGRRVRWLRLLSAPTAAASGGQGCRVVVLNSRWELRRRIAPAPRTSTARGDAGEICKHCCQPSRRRSGRLCGRRIEGVQQLPDARTKGGGIPGLLCAEWHTHLRLADLISDYSLFYRSDWKFERLGAAGEGGRSAWTSRPIIQLCALGDGRDGSLSEFPGEGPIAAVWVGKPFVRRCRRARCRGGQTILGSTEYSRHSPGSPLSWA
jgi:hypothetical protein